MPETIEKKSGQKPVQSHQSQGLASFVCRLFAVIRQNDSTFHSSFARSDWPRKLRLALMGTCFALTHYGLARLLQANIGELSAALTEPLRGGVFPSLQRSASPFARAQGGLTWQSSREVPAVFSTTDAQTASPAITSANNVGVIRMILQSRA